MQKKHAGCSCWFSTGLPLGGVAALVSAVVGLAAAGTAIAQPAVAEVFTDDSPIARSTLDTLDELIGRGNPIEAARTLQRVLEEHGGQVIEQAPGMPGVSGGDDSTIQVAVRARITQTLIARPALLRSYRNVFGETAERALAISDPSVVARDFLLTPAGFEASLRVAQRHLEGARFHASLRTLLELDGHPDREGAGAVAAARLASLVARFVPDGEAASLARRWLGEASLDPQLDAVFPSPASGRSRPISPLTNQAAGAVLEGVLPTPIAMVSLPIAGVDNVAGSARVQRPGTQRRESARSWAVPVIVGDLVIINDGQALSAWDRYSLTNRWVSRPPSSTGGSRVPGDQVVGLRVAQRTAELTSLVADGGLIFAAVNFDDARGVATDPRVHAFNAATGEVLWSVDPRGFDRALESSSPTGPLTVEEGTVVALMRVAQRAQRLTSVGLAGIDRETGRKRWHTPLGSIGSLPYRQFQAPITATASDRGVVYASDPIGVVGAVNASTGEPIWVRSMPGLDVTRATRTPGWRISRPVLTRTDLITISPDTRSVLVFDRETGETRAAIDTAQLVGSPVTNLIRVGDRLAAFNDELVGFVPLSSLAEGVEPQIIRFANRGGLALGLPWALGDALAIPAPSGLVRVTPDATEPVDLLPLDSSGHTVADDGQLLVVTGAELRSYLNWQTSSEILRARIASSPADPGPAIALAELAFKGERPEEILPAIDLALRAIDSVADAGDETPVAGRAPQAVLFSSMEAMLEQAIAEFDQESPGDRSMDPELLVGFVDRMGRLARSDEERLAQTLLAASVATHVGDIPDAVALYQAVLADVTLAVSMWTTPQKTARGETEATRQLERLITAHGGNVYAAFDDDASAELSGISPNAGPEDAIDIAKRYPLAISAPQAWLVASELALERSVDDAERADSSRYLRAAYGTARRLHRIGREVDTEVIAEIVSRLLLPMIASDQLDEAADMIRTATTLGVAAIGADGDSQTISALRDIVTQRRSIRRTAARISTRFPSTLRTDLLSGYLLEPIVSNRDGGGDLGVDAPDGALVRSPRDGTMNWITPAGPADPGVVAQAWSRTVTSEPTLLARGDASAWLAFEDERGVSIERVDLRDGGTIWRSSSFGEAIGQGRPDAGGVAARRDRRSPAMLLAMHRGQIAVADSRGIVGVFDASNGTRTQVIETGLSEITDIDIRGETVVAIGTTVSLTDPRIGEIATLVAHDASSGDLLHRREGLPGDARWIRLSTQGEVVVGATAGVLALAASNGEQLWEIRDQVVGEAEGMILGQRLALVDREGVVRSIDLVTGTVGPDGFSLRSPPRGSDPFMRGLRFPDGEGIGIANAAGLVRVGDEGMPLWRDAIVTNGVLTPPALAERSVVVVETRAGMADELGRKHRLHIIDAATGRVTDTADLSVFANPESVAVIDGAILVSAGDVILAIAAPALADDASRVE
ncbi:MAG: PQQ-binding-like beta-propeller repeat protein [Planctomycetota bacterium]